MSDTIHYYLTTLSPFVYLGHTALMEMAVRHGKKVAFKPVHLPGVWEVSGSVPLGQRSETRKRYRLLELQRQSEYRRIDLNLHPQFFPTDPELADRSIIAIVLSGEDPQAFARAVGQALWENDRQIADETVINELLAETGFDANAVLEVARAPETAKIREINTAEAVAAGAIGVPSYVYKEEVFWGQDQIAMLERMIESGRNTYSTE
jgi:2-hydroxychromene-2-carboxylate isomerase